MAWNGSGTYTQTDGVYSGDGICAAQAGDGDAVIYAAEMDALLEDHAAAIHACLAKNGENAATANLDGGGFRFTNLTASANTDAAVHGDVIASGAFAGTDITFTQNDGTTIVVDVSGLTAGTGGVDLTTAQSVGGIKTFTSLSSMAHVKFNGPTTSKVENIASGGTPTCDTTAAASHYLAVSQNGLLDFTWPTAASDTQLGTHWVKRGVILMRWAGASYTMGFNAAMLAALDDYEIEGTHVTGSGEMCSLAYTYWYLNGTKYAQFAWVATA